MSGNVDDVAMEDADDSAAERWRLVRSYASDYQGVRAACVLPPPPPSGGSTSSSSPVISSSSSSSSSSSLLVTGTQAGGMYFYDFDTGALLVDVEAFQHDHAVASLVSLPPLAERDSTGSTKKRHFASGSKDAVIRIFAYDDGGGGGGGDEGKKRARDEAGGGDDDPNSSSSSSSSSGGGEKMKKLELLFELRGHERPVTSLSVLPGGGGEGGEYYLASGSWDGTCAIWNLETRARVAVLEGHENSVCVAPWIGGGVGNNNANLLGVATGSAGVASQGSIVKHALRLWQVDVRTGEKKIVHEVVQDHDGPIRDVVASISGDLLLATCSNDGTVKLRSASTGRSETTLTFVVDEPHPPMLLSCAHLRDPATVVAGAEDGHVVAWDVGQRQQQHRPPQIIRHPACVWQVFAVDGGGDGKCLFGTCCQDGKVYLFSCGSGDSVVADPALQRDFDQAVEAATASKRKGPSEEEIAKLPLWENQISIEGRSDGQVQVFNEGGVAIAAQWSAASRTWIKVGQVMGSSGDADEGEGGGGSGTLNGVHYDHIFPIQADQTGGGVANLKIGYNNGENPFVAAQRFIDEHMLPQHHLSEIADYITQRVGNSNITLGGGAGAAGGALPAPAATSGVPMVAYQHMPAKTYKSFDMKPSAAAATFDKMKTKLREFGCLSDDQLQRVDSLMKSLSAADAAMSDSDLNVLVEKLNTMPISECFPALDLARLAVLRPDAASTPEREAIWISLFQKALSLCQEAGNKKLEGPAAVAIPMLSLRLCSNAFANGSSSKTSSIAAAHLMDVLSCAKAHVRSPNKNVRLSVATVLHNACLHLHSTGSVGDAVADVVVDIVDDVFTCRLYNESEAVMRTLVAVGTLIMSSPAAKKAGNQRFLAAKVEPAASPHSQDVKVAAKEVYSLLA